MKTRQDRMEENLNAEIIQIKTGQEEIKNEIATVVSEQLKTKLDGNKGSQSVIEERVGKVEECSQRKCWQDGRSLGVSCSHRNR